MQIQTENVFEKIGVEVAELLNLDILNIRDVSPIDDVLYLIQTEDKQSFTFNSESKELKPGKVNIENGNKYTKEEKDEITEKNIALVYYVLKRINSNGIPYDELVSVGMLGFTKALNSFNKNKDTKFSTYAISCIQNEIYFFLRKEQKHIMMNVSFEKELSTDGNGNVLTVEDTIDEAQMGGKSLEELIIDDDNKSIIMKAISRLTEDEQYIIIHKFGLDGRTPKTQIEIAEAINMSQANISKIQKNCLKKLKLLLQRKL